MQCWINGPATGGIDKKIKMANIPFENQYSIVPPFHYSIFEANPEAPKTFIFSVGCRNSETFFSLLAAFQGPLFPSAVSEKA
jgi:hypothetical protein